MPQVWPKIFIFVFSPHKRTYREYLLQHFFHGKKNYRSVEKLCFSRTIEYSEDVKKKKNKLDIHITTWKNLMLNRKSTCKIIHMANYH